MRDKIRGRQRSRQAVSTSEVDNEACDDPEADLPLLLRLAGVLEGGCVCFCGSPTGEREQLVPRTE